MLAELLSEAGFSCANGMGKDKWNRHGYFEDPKVMRLNDNLLKMLGGSWDNPPKENVKPPRRFRLPEEEVIKDPRFCLTLKHFAGNFKIVKIKRSCRSVARSLNKRDGFPYIKGLRLWKIYNSEMDQYPGLTLEYERLIKGKDLDKLGRYVGRKITGKTISKRLKHC